MQWNVLTNTKEQVIKYRGGGWLLNTEEEANKYQERGY